MLGFSVYAAAAKGPGKVTRGRSFPGPFPALSRPPQVGEVRWAHCWGYHVRRSGGWFGAGVLPGRALSISELCACVRAKHAGGIPRGLGTRGGGLRGRVWLSSRNAEPFRRGDGVPTAISAAGEP